jgi:hypothetical protein
VKNFSAFCGNRKFFGGRGGATDFQWFIFWAKRNRPLQVSPIASLISSSYFCLGFHLYPVSVFITMRSVLFLHKLFGLPSDSRSLSFIIKTVYKFLPPTSKHMLTVRENWNSHCYISFYSPVFPCLSSCNSILLSLLVMYNGFWVFTWRYFW